MGRTQWCGRGSDWISVAAASGTAASTALLSPAVFIMRFLAPSLILLSVAVSQAAARQRKKPQLESDQGIEPCRPSGSRRFVEYGYGQLLEAGIYEEDKAKKLRPVKKRGLGADGLDLKIGKEYVIKTKFLAKKVFFVWFLFKVYGNQDN